MENYADMYKNICRVCLKITKSEQMVSLNDDTDSNGLSCFAKAILVFAQVSYKKDDKLPQNVCQKCIYLLKQAIYFKFTCESSEKWLKNILETNLKDNVSDSQILENICQYVMYRHYFPENNVFTTAEKRKNCSPTKKCVFKQHDASKTSLSMNNKEINHIDYNLNNNNRLEDSNNDSSDLEDHCNIKLEQQETKSTPMLLQVNKKEKKAKMDKEYLINTMKSIIKKKESKEKLKEQKSMKQRDIPCEICNKVLANRATYSQHMQRHNVCMYVCDKCGKGCPVLAELHIHQISRHGIGPYLQCEHCPYKAPTKLRLKEHIRLHTGERPFTCEKCGLTFRRQAIWRKHQAQHMEKKFQCQLCPLKFYHRENLADHMNNVHERKYLYICNICEVTYAKTATVRHHMIVKHGIKRELQGRIRRVDKTLHCFPEK